MQRSEECVENIATVSKILRCIVIFLNIAIYRKIRYFFQRYDTIRYDIL